MLYSHDGHLVSHRHACHCTMQHHSLVPPWCQRAMMVTWWVANMPAIALIWLSGATVKYHPDVIQPWWSLGVSQTCLPVHYVVPQFSVSLMSQIHNSHLVCHRHACHCIKWCHKLMPPWCHIAMIPSLVSHRHACHCTKWYHHLVPSWFHIAMIPVVLWTDTWYLWVTMDLW